MASLKYRRDVDREERYALNWSPMAHGIHSRLRDVAWRYGPLRRDRLHFAIYVSPGEMEEAWKEIASEWMEAPGRPGYVVCPEIEAQRRRPARRVVAAPFKRPLDA